MSRPVTWLIPKAKALPLLIPLWAPIRAWTLAQCIATQVCRTIRSLIAGAITAGELTLASQAYRSAMHEQELNIAEGINRGWVTGNAETYYIAGIQASWSSYNIPVNGNLSVHFYHPGASDVTNTANYDTFTVPVNWTNYYTQASVQYAGGATGTYSKFYSKKYLALFLHSGLEAYFQFRRTGVPVFTTGPGTANGQRIALRFQYPASRALCQYS